MSFDDNPRFVSEYNHPNSRVHDVWVHDGLAYSEIGEILGCTEKAARNAASRGRKRLRKTLAKEERNASD